MNELQSKLLDILKWFHNFCEEHNLQYFLIGGTLLGAIRHKGFIPWDDDIDVGMPREDYMKFISLTNNNRDGKYFIDSIYNDNEYFYKFAKIYDTTTTLIESNYDIYKMIRGVYIDVFPIDGAYNSVKKNTINLKKIILKSTLYYKRRYNLVPLKLFKKIIFKFLLLIPARQSELMKIDKYCKSLPTNKGFVGNYYGAWGIREFYPRIYIFSEDGSRKKATFEGFDFYVVNDPDKYLTNVYGDYMTLPPEEKRVSHHNFKFLDLNMPYEEYIRNNKK